MTPVVTPKAPYQGLLRLLGITVATALFLSAGPAKADWADWLPGGEVPGDSSEDIPLLNDWVNPIVDGFFIPDSYEGEIEEFDSPDLGDSGSVLSPNAGRKTDKLNTNIGRKVTPLNKPRNLKAASQSPSKNNGNRDAGGGSRDGKSAGRGNGGRSTSGGRF